MIEQWILDKLDPLKRAPIIILRDPQRMIKPGAHVVDGWAEENGYSVLFCAGNLALREMYEAVRDDQSARVLVVDRSREGTLFYPDLAVAAGARRQMSLSLRDFLVEKTGDSHWPFLVNDRNLSALILENLPDTLRAFEQLRQVNAGRFSDSDLYKIVLGGTLKINPFKKLSAGEIRRLCIEQHQAIERLNRLLPADVMDTLRRTIAEAPKPFCWLLERDPAQVTRSFTLAAIMHQHGLEYQVLLSNLDPALRDYRDIDPGFLNQAIQDQLALDPECVVADVHQAEAFLLDDPARLAFLLRDRLQLDDPQRAFQALERERLAPLIRGLALISLLADLIETKKLGFHQQVLELLNRQAEDATLLALRRPTEQWQALENAYRRAIEVYRLTSKLAEYGKQFTVTPAQEMSLGTFDQLWNKERLNRLDYYVSDLERMLRVSDMLPAPRKAFWPQLGARWDKAHSALKETIQAIGEAQNLIDARFQDVYRLHYTTWIKQADALVVFTHQFLPRLVRTHWDPRSKRKAVVMVFDGLRADAWDELLRPVFEERFELIESRPGSALIPTETHLSRKAISAGCLPVEFTAGSELDLLKAWLKKHLGLSPRFEIVKDDDTLASGMTVRYVSDVFEYIVFNFSDKNLHHNEQELAFIYNNTMRAIIRDDVRSVLRELPDDALLFITSDHGFIPTPAQTVTIPDDIVADPQDISYRNARVRAHLEGAEARHVLDFDVRVMDIPPTSEAVTGSPINYVVFPRPGYILRRKKGHRPPDRYTHGGLSLAECQVPMVVMGPRQPDRGKPALRIASVQQVGSNSEGELLTLEITIAPAQKSDLAITLSFSRDEIPTRKEVIGSQAATYTVRWKPRLDDITDDERRAGIAIRPVTAILAYRQGQETVRISQSVDVRIKLDTTRLRRRLDSRLDLLMGKVPDSLKT